MKKNLLILSVFILLVFITTAQKRTVDGLVKSFEDNIDLPGVAVIIKGTSKGTVTNAEGYFSFAGIVDTDILVFSFFGFETQEVLVGTQSNINIILKASSEELEEVVVTALGIKRQEREIGYSTQKIDADDMVRSNAPNIINAIIGRSAGIQVSQGDGVEGGSTRITIRGNNNLSSGNQPLIVVDNIPMENTSGLNSIRGGIDWGNPLSDINPLDIEDYTILKGGAASALYGSRGANGVILITTKRGKKQNGIGIKYNYSYKTIQAYRFREMQNEYGHGGPISFTPPQFPMSGDTLLYPGIYGTDNLIINQEGETSSTTTEFGYYGSAVSWGPRMEGQSVKWWDGEMRAYSPQPNNYSSVFQNGYTQTHNISASGGSEHGTMRVSVTRQDHKSIIENSDFNRTTINLGAGLKISRKVTANISSTYINFNRLNSPILGETENSFSKGFLYSWPRSYKLLDRENYEYSTGGRNPQEGNPFQYVSDHLWWNYYNNNTNLNRDKYLGSLTFTYDITSWLNLLGRVGRDFTLDQFETRNKPVDVIGLQDGYYANNLIRTRSDIFEGFIIAEKEKIFDSKVNVRYTLGAGRWDYNRYSIGGHSGTWYYPDMYTFFNYTETTYTTDANGNTIVDRPGDNAKLVTANEEIVQERNNSVFSFLNLSYDNYLFLEFTGRNDWSSTLPSGDNSYFYPSVSLSFIASDAFKITERLTWLNFIKIRGGYAQTATDTEPYQIDFYYSTQIFGGEQSSNFPDTIPPHELAPQRVNAYETGISIGFLENRIDLDFTYYYMYSYDQILKGLPIPVSSGAPAITINKGILTNKGFEIILNIVPVQTNNILYKTGINLSRNRNYVVSLGDYADVLPLADIWGLNGPAIALREGDEYGTIYGYDHLYHENGQPIVNDEGTKYLISDVRVPIGNASPDLLAAWYNELSYKGFIISTLIDTKWGGDIYCGSYVINLQSGQSPETLIERNGGGLPYTDPDGNTSNIGIILDGVYEDGSDNDQVVHYYYKYLPNAGGWGKFISTPGIIENTWVKMREISLAYTFPQNLLNKTKIFQSLTLSLVGRNLFYLYTTLPDKINPEGIMGSGNAQGFEWASLPSTRAVTFGLSASF